MANKTLAFEIGTEELPAFDLHNATLQLQGLAEKALTDARISFGEVKIYSTPRRLIVMATDVPEETEGTEDVFRGPSIKIAFDADGNPTKACEGFARGKGVDVASLERRDENGVEYVYAIKSVPSMHVAELLPELLQNLITAISWPKTQRWGSCDAQFSRPVRWLFAMYGETVIPVEFAGLTAGNTTRGHRFLAPAEKVVASADDLINVIRESYVVPTEAEREASIREQIKAVEERTGWVADLPAKTMAEVVNLAEYPTIMVGKFDELFLAVPKEIIVDAMLVHQRYFPLFDKEGKLLNYFLITSNGNPASEAQIVDGNQRVVAARLYDAKFFYDEDLAVPMDEFVERLKEVVFQEKLGTTFEKTRRIVEVASALAEKAELSDQEQADVARAAHLCKADLVSGAVIEFTSVQGIMGSYYAEAAGETPAVVRAIADHYRPRFAGDELPADVVGRMVAFADKLDTICGLFAINQGPTGSSDPFALRRSAIGIVAMLSAGLPVSLNDAIDRTLAAYAEGGLEFDAAATKEAVLDFFVTRTKVILKDAGHGGDVIDAVLSCGVTEPAIIELRVAAIEKARVEDAETMDDLAIAYARANNLRKPELGMDVDESMLIEFGKNLVIAINDTDKAVAEALAQGDYPAALAQLASLRTPIDEFFANVMVMDEDVALQENRLRLLNRFVDVFASIADFGKLVK